MAYREQPSTGAPSCHRHPAASAVEHCGRCAQPICDPCVSFVGTRAHCPACAKSARRARLVSRIAMSVVALLVAGGLGGWLYSQRPRFDYGVYKQDVAAARARIEAERCDRQATITYQDLLLRAGDQRGALEDVTAFVARCGDWYRVHWTAYTAHSRLSERKEAIAEASKLIEHNPSDKDYRWWRGVIYEELGDAEHAIADFREAIRLEPRLTNIPFNLANLLEKKGEHCEAKRVVEQFLAYHPDAADEPTLARLARLTNACPSKP